MTSAAEAAAPPRVDVEDVLRRGGLTRFHRKAILVTGVAWTFVAMEILLVGFLLLGGLSAFAFAVADSAGVYVTALFFVGFFNLGAWGAVYPFTAEAFPTRLRSSAFGVMEGVGKAAAIAGPYIFGHLNDATGSTTWSITFVAIVMASGGLVTAVFGRETRGQRLT